MLFFLDRILGDRAPTFGLEARCARLGEPSRDGLGDDVAEVAVEALNGVTEDLFTTGEDVDCVEVLGPESRA